MARTAAPVLIVACLLLACASKSPPRAQIQLPPRVDLSEFRTLGIVAFHAEDPQLGDLATRQFLEMIQEAQPGVRVVELGSRERVLGELGRPELDHGAARSIGEEFGVDAVFTGDFEVSRVKPSVRFGRSLTTLRASADVTGQLAAKLLETRSGATVWTASSSATANVARLGVPEKGLPTFGVTAPEDASSPLVSQLVGQLGGDFYPTWQ